MSVKKIVKPYDKILHQEYKPLLSSELHEVQDILRLEDNKTRVFGAGDGPFGDGFRVYVKDDSTLKITAGFFIHKGETLYLDSDVELPYDINTIDQGELYEVVCTWSNIIIDESHDSSIKDVRVGKTSDRLTKELVFSLNRSDEKYSYSLNRLILSRVYFDGSISTPVPLQHFNLTDSRYEFSQHYVASGMSIESYSVVGNNLELTLSQGAVFYLGSYYKTIDESTRKWVIPLPNSIDNRIQLYLKEEQTLDEGIILSPRFVEMSLGSTITGISLPLFEITVSSLGLVVESVNDLRVYEPISRAVKSSKGLQNTAGDFYALKPTETSPPSLRVEVIEGWYYYKGEYYFQDGKYFSHALPTTGMVKRDSVVINEDLELALYESPEVMEGNTPVDASPEGSIRIYDVILNDSTVSITYPNDPSSLDFGELRDLRPIIKAKDFASNISVKDEQFSGTLVGGLSQGLDKDLQGYMEEVDTSLVGLTTSIKQVGLLPEDSPGESVELDSNFKIQLGHDVYLGDNTNRSTRVGISIKKDPYIDNRVVISNTWDDDLRLLASPVVLDSSYHTHANMDVAEAGAEVRFSSRLLDYNSPQGMVMFSDLVLSGSIHSKFIEVPPGQGVPSHIGMRLDPQGGLEFSTDGYRVNPESFLPKFNPKKSIIDLDGNGYGIYISPTISALEFVDDPADANRSFLKVKHDDSLSIYSGGELGLKFNSLSPIQKNGSGELVFRSNQPLDVDATGFLSFRYNDASGDLSLASYLDVVADTTSPSKSYLRVKVAEKKGLGSYTIGGDPFLAVLVEKPIDYNSTTGAIKFNYDPNFFSVNASNQLTFMTGGLSDGSTIVEGVGGQLTVNTDSQQSVYSDPVNGIGVVVSDPLYHDNSLNPNGISLRVESNNPTLYVNSADANSLGVYIDPYGGIVRGPNGIRLEGFIDSSVLKYGYILGGSFVGGLTGSFIKFDLNFDTLSFLAEIPTSGYRYASCFCLGDDAHYFGGMDTNDILQSSHDTYDFQTDSWQASSTLSDSFARGVSVGLDSRYGTTFGVTSNSGADPVLVYDNDTESWITSSADIKPLMGVGSTVSHMAGDKYTIDKVCFTGGYDGTSYHNSIYIMEFAPDKSSVLSVSTLTSVYSNSASALDAFSISDNYIHFLGGSDDTSNFRSHDSIDILASFVTAKAPLPFTGKSKTSSFVVGDQAVVIGGSDSVSNFTEDVLLYDEITDTWKTSVKLLRGMEGTSTFSR